MDNVEIFTDINNLPKPLSSEELYELLEKIKQGDEQAREKIIVHNIRLVLYEVTNRFKSFEYDKKDLVSVGIIGLMKAISTFDTLKKIEFSTYAIRCIDNEILMFLRKLKKDQTVYSLDTPIYRAEDDDELKLEDRISDETDMVLEYTDNETYQVIRQIVKNLPKRDREIIMLRFGFYNDKIYTQKEIADMMSISQPQVSKLITKNVKRLGEELQQKGLIELRIDGQKVLNKKRGANTIYEYFAEYSREEIDIVASQLSPEDKALLKLKFGDTFDELVRNSALSKKESNRFYSVLVPKMKRKLAALRTGEVQEETELTKGITDVQNDEKAETAYQVATFKYLDGSSLEKETVSGNLEKTNSVAEVEDMVDSSNSKVSESSEGLSSKFIQGDYIKILEFLKTPLFTDMLETLDTKTAMIISLKFGYIDGKYFSNDAIAEFIGMEKSEVTLITRKVIELYRDSINSFIDGLREESNSLIDSVINDEINGTQLTQLPNGKIRSYVMNYSDDK